MKKANKLEKLLLIGGLSGLLFSVGSLYEIDTRSQKQQTIEMSRVLNIESKLYDLGKKFSSGSFCFGSPPTFIRDMLNLTDTSYDKLSGYVDLIEQAKNLKQEYDSLLLTREIEEEKNEMKKNVRNSSIYGILMGCSLIILGRLIYNRLRG